MPRTCVIYNPKAGRGRAKQLMAAARHRFGAETEFWPTRYRWHAAELAQQAAEQGFAKVVAAGGDGTVHEVGNGLLDAGRSDVVFSVLPIGSMNDFGYHTGMNGYWHRGGRFPTEVHLCDVGRITTPKHTRWIINSVGLGFTAFVTVEAHKIKHLRGLLLYSLALFRAVAFHYRKPVREVELDGVARRGPLLALSLFLGQREGGFPLVPAARNDDGLFDYMLAGAIQWWEILRYFPAILAGTLPQNHPELALKRCRTARLRSDEPLCIHVDGELFCIPEDDQHEARIELLERRLPVEVCPRFRFGANC